MNFDILSFIFGKLNCGSNFNDVVSYLLGKAVSAVWKTITNVAIASFTAVSSTLRELVVDITPVQSGSGDPSPDNVRSISGWTGANVARDGKNLFDDSSADWSAGHYISQTGSIVDSSSYKYMTAYAVIKPGTYTVQYNYDDRRSRDFTIAVYDKDKTFIERLEAIHTTSSGVVSGTIVVPANAVYYRIASAEISNHGRGSYNIQIELGNQATTYEPYTGTTINVNWADTAGTIYKGYLQYNGDGTWTPIATYAWNDMGDLEWTYVDSSRFSASPSGIESKNSWNPHTCYCSVFKQGVVPSDGSGTDNTFGYIASKIFVRASAYSDSATFTTAVTGQTVVYPLATPIVGTPITTAELVTLLGNNNIFADCGNINTITYRES